MTTIVRPRSTKKYQTLTKVLGMTDEQAMTVLTSIGIVEPTPAVDPVVAQLVATKQFTVEQAESIVANLNPKVLAHEPVVVAETPKQKAEALVAASQYEFTKGRVYVNSNITEAVVRVLKTGSPEIVQTSGVGHVPAVLVYREESGDAAIQNLKG